MKYTAIYNATRKELAVCSAAQMGGILAHAAARGDDVCYTLADFEYIDSVMLASYTADDFYVDGWRLMA